MGSQAIEEKTGNCDGGDGACLSVDLQWEEVSGGLDTSSMEKINQTILHALAAQFAPDGSAPPTPELSARAMAESFKEYMAALGPRQAGWEWTARGVAYLNASGLLGYSIENYSYTGGAHGMGTQTYLLFSTSTGNLLSLNDFLKPESRKELEKDAELRFKESMDLRVDANLESSGFWFPDNQFYLPDNFKLQKSGVLFRFEVYEVGPYALGALEFVMPWKEVKPFLQDDYQSVLVEEE